MKLYLAGPMTGVPEMNRPLFKAETARLRSLGYEVVSPAEISAGCEDGWLPCMRRDIAELVKCDGVALLPDWRSSRGARLEHYITEGLGLVVVEARHLHSPRSSTIAPLLQYGGPR